MMGVDLYENPVRTILEEALSCDKSGGVITSVPILHATPGAFITHTNNRRNTHHLQDGFREVQPTFAMGTCAGIYQPSEALKQSMITGGLKSSHSFLFQDAAVLAEDFYESIQDKDPDDGHHVLACFGGQYSKGKDGYGRTLENMPFRGLDSSYSGRWCSKGSVVKDEDMIPIGVNPTTSSTLCSHWPQDELKNIPHMKENVAEALKFLGKDDNGFFMMFEQGDIDWAA
jgi:alkaline phosphatase